ISSYGTVRELKMLERIDMQKTKYLIIQYSDNDVWENKVYSGKNNSLPIAEQQEYRKVVAEHARDTRGYRFGLYMYELQKEVVNNLIHTLRRPFMPKEDQTAASDEEAALFVNALKNAHANLKGIKIIVMEINGRAFNDTLFTDSLKRQREKPGQPECIKTMTIIDSSKFLTKDHYFFWDDHLKPEGHKAVADVLTGVIN
ncbi:MAG: hypothetical protein KAJ60_10405, partial [Desulfobulbaceae bacterium]|nr:hypothetical protein [Desulfobulbaceae bacterium]